MLRMKAKASEHLGSLSSPPIRCTIEHADLSMHLTQIITGFCLLKNQGLIRLKFRGDRRLTRFKNWMTLRLEDGRRILYDVKDGYLDARNRCQAFDDALDDYDLCFKRSFGAEINSTLRNGHQNRPLGFNYNCTIPGSRANYPTRFDTFSEAVRKLKKLRPNAPNSWRSSHVRVFEPETLDTTGHAEIIFMTRVWGLGASGDSEYERSLAEFHLSMDEARAETIRLCRKEFGSRFLGGLAPSALAKVRYPDLVVDDAGIVQRSHYLSLMKRAKVCIASVGLHRSNGFKLGEYIAAAKAIVSERLYYDVPGDFENGQHYLEYRTPSECVACVDQILSSPDLQSQLESNNRDYYQAYLRPDRLVLNTLIESFGGESQRSAPLAENAPMATRGDS